MDNFVSWLNQELEKRRWKPADLSRASGLDSAVLSNIMNGSRGVGIKTANAIAKALKLPSRQVFEVAGILDPDPESNLTPEEAELVYLFEQLSDEDQEEIIRIARLKLELKGEPYATKKQNPNLDSAATQLGRS